MAKQQILKFENGATMVYQKQKAFNGYSFVIGFRSGAQLDGKYKGCSHLLEHLFFRKPSKNITDNILNTVFNNLGTNACTTATSIYALFSATSDNIVPILRKYMEFLTDTHFSEKQIKQEIDVIKQEITMHKGQEQIIDAKDVVFSQLINDHVYTHTLLDILGSPRTLHSITPNILKNYVERYFNLDNLVISVTTNKSLSETIDLCDKEIFSKLKNASSPEFIVPFSKPVSFNINNVMYAHPDKESHNVSIDLIFRANEEYPENPSKQYAFDVVESYLLNSVGGVLYQALRVDKNLCYIFGCKTNSIGQIKYKDFFTVTNSSKMRTALAEMCKLIRKIGENGYSKTQFDAVVKTITDSENAQLQKFENCSAMYNYEHLLSSTPFVDYKEAMEYIKNINYNEFCDYISSIYKTASVSVAVDGNFDNRKMYNLIEIEQMLGNYSHSQNLQDLNIPLAQAVSSVNTNEYIDEFQKSLNAEINKTYGPTPPLQTTKIDQSQKKKIKKANNSEQSKELEK